MNLESVTKLFIYTAAEAPSTSAAAPAKDAPINKKSYLPRLGLARAYALTTDTIKEAQKYYGEVMDMAPEVRETLRLCYQFLKQTD